LALLDHYDHGLLETVERVSANGRRLNVIEVLCDIRDPHRVSYWLEKIRPDVVIHAAALKHVHLGERHPGECVLTNLIGMQNVLTASVAAGAERFLLVSTDKAASPVCVMGASKRLGELYIEGMHGASKTVLKAVRFGNVLGSQGSVEPRFAAQIRAGGPLQVTHPDMQRYFMSLEQAVDLLLSVTALDDEGGVYFMEMGEAVSILEMGREMIARSGKDVPIEIVGLRPGEKLNEELFDEYEHVSSTSLPGVFKVAPLSAQAHVTASDLAQLETLARSTEDAVVRQRVFAHLDARLGRDEPAVG
jgi:FlaA1/EpsC-like NDP-sugar epimerase